MDFLGKIGASLNNIRSECIGSGEENNHRVEKVTEAALVSFFNFVNQFIKLADITVQQNDELILSFVVSQNCELIRKEEKEEKIPVHSLGTYEDGTVVESFDSIIYKYYVYFWNFSVNYKFLLKSKNSDSEDITELNSNQFNFEIQSLSSELPFECAINSMKEINIFSLFKYLQNETGVVEFKLNKNHKKYKSPCRNLEIETIMLEFARIYNWANEVLEFFNQSVLPAQNLREQNYLDFSVIKQFFSIYYIADMRPIQDFSNEVRLETNLNEFIELQNLKIQQKLEIIRKTLASAPEMSEMFQFIFLIKHAKQIVYHFAECIFHIEKQNIQCFHAAIGKHLTPQDVTQYMNFFNKKLFLPPYQRQFFSYYYKRNNFTSQEGMVSIDTDSDTFTTSEAISAFVGLSKPRDANSPMKLVLNKNAELLMAGKEYLHCWIAHEFSGSPNPSNNICINARVNQFSCLLLLLGTVNSANEFHPQYGITLRNKDQFKIPLHSEYQFSTFHFSEEMHTALSPDQQQFIKMFTKLQSDGNIFAYAVIHVKPQLEKIFNLPPLSLSKDLRLASDLIDFLTTHDIPEEFYRNKRQLTPSEFVKAYTPAPQSLLSPKLITSVSHAESGFSESLPFPAWISRDSKHSKNESSRLFFDDCLEIYSETNFLVPTILKPGCGWTKQYSPSILSKPITAVLTSDDVSQESRKTFRFLEFLSLRGSLILEEASLHLVVASTHCFDQSLLNVIKNNVNPVDGIIASELIVASVIHRKPAGEIIEPVHLDKAKYLCPQLFAN